MGSEEERRNEKEEKDGGKDTGRRKERKEENGKNGGKIQRKVVPTLSTAASFRVSRREGPSSRSASAPLSRGRLQLPLVAFWVVFISSGFHS